MNARSDYPSAPRVCDQCQDRAAGVVIGCVELCGRCAVESWEKGTSGDVDEEEEAA